jgi:hypothetical protein
MFYATKFQTIMRKQMFMLVALAATLFTACSKFEALQEKGSTTTSNKLYGK